MHTFIYKGYLSYEMDDKIWDGNSELLYIIRIIRYGLYLDKVLNINDTT